MEERNESGYSEGRKHTMTANELRIGNWVKLKDSPTTPYWQVESVGNLIMVGGQLWSIEEIEPIPLTEEWLVKFGFRQLANIWEFWGNSEWNLYKDGGWYLLNGYICVDCIEIKHVNQLQNLFHALTGEELKI